MKKDILKILERQGLLSPDRVATIEERISNKESFDEILESFQIPADKVADAKSQVYDLLRYIDKDPSLDTVKKLSEDSSQHYKMIYLGEDESSLTMGVLDPEISGLKDAATFLARVWGNKSYKFFIISFTQYKNYLNYYKGIMNDTVDETEVSDSIDKSKTSESGGIKFNTGDKGDDSPVVRLVRDVLAEAIKKGASDIHIEPGATQVRFRYRIDGDLVIVREIPMTNHMAVIARIKILSNLKLDEKRKPQDGHFSIDYEGRKIDFRVSSFPSYFGEKIVVRILDTYKGVRTMVDLGMLTQHEEIVKEALKYPYGIVLISGPTGSGKTSTLYSMLNSLDKEDRNIVSLEDPIEYSLAGVNQSQVVPDIGYTFATGLRSILRQDPDIIMVGEIRDAETAELAVQAALTGHLVFSTIHTNNSVSTITRLIEMGIPSYLIAPTVRLVVAQRLVHKLVPESKGAHEYIPVDGGYQEMVRQQFGDLPPTVLETLPFSEKFHNPKMSDYSHSGMEGRQAIFEMFVVDKQIEEAIVEKKSEAEIYKMAREKGMITLKEDAMLKSMQGIVPFTESMGL
jgi:type IV pilus assembly protein PilB